MTWILVLAGLYLAVVALFVVQQDRLVFAAQGRGDRGVPEGIPGLSIDRVRRGDGGSSRIALVPYPSPRAYAVLFTGNGEDLHAGVRMAADLMRYGLTVICSEHPGYGASDGPASVASFLAEAEAVGRHARALAQAEGLPLVVVGNSIGTFCAVHAAALGLADRLLLRAPPTSLVAAGKARFAWLPVDWLLRHRFDSLGKAKDVHCPTLVLHGDQDAIVPIDLGRQLARAIAGPSEFVECPGFGHNDLPLAADGPFGARIAAFLAER